VILMWALLSLSCPYGAIRGGCSRELSVSDKLTVDTDTQGELSTMAAG